MNTEKHENKARNIILHLNDNDAEEVLNFCAKVNINISELIGNFLADLVGGSQCNGSDERAAALSWFRRSLLDMYPTRYYLSFLTEKGLDLENIIDYLDDFDSTTTDLNNVDNMDLDDLLKILVMDDHLKEISDNQDKVRQYCIYTLKEELQRIKEQLYWSDYNNSYNEDQLSFEEAIKSIKQWLEVNAPFNSFILQQK